MMHLVLLTFCSLVSLAVAAPEPETMNCFVTGPISPPVRTPFPDGKFTLGENETVVFAGGTNFVREAKSGILEAVLTEAFAAQKPVFRSMAVDGDTVYEPAHKMNFGSWRKQLEAVGATVVIAQFGQMESLDGIGRLPEFVAAYHRLLDEFSARTQRIVLVSPMHFEVSRWGSRTSGPEDAKRQADVIAYWEVVRTIAKQRGAVFVDLSALRGTLDRMKRAPMYHPVTDNGVHLNERGLRHAASMIARQLGVPFEGLGRPFSPERFFPIVPQDPRSAIVAKNRLWSACWRSANWAFADGDRNTAPPDGPGGGQPDLKETFAQYRALLATADARIAALTVLADKKAPFGLPQRPSPLALPAPLDSPAPVPPVEEKALSPQEELATFTVADGYKVQLFASERDGVVKPTHMAWDERGRMYIACAPDYPHIPAGAPPGDFILVCEDTDRDGRADKSWKLAEGLTRVSGIALGDGGVYVRADDELLHFEGSNPDGRLNQGRVVLSGLGVTDTRHQLLNSITRGDDGSLWFPQGRHVRSHVETPWGIARPDQSGLWRLRPATSRLDGFYNSPRAGRHCWGVVVDDWGQIFHEAAEDIRGDDSGSYYSIPGLVRAVPGLGPDGYGQFVAHQPVDAYTKSTATDILGSRALPKETEGCLVIGRFFDHEVELRSLKATHSGFRRERLRLVMPTPDGTRIDDSSPLLRSSSGAFRPLGVSQGPDGAIYVCDFYSRTIGHDLASYRDPERDRTHGRIWRITAKGHAPVKQPNLAAMDVPALLEQLRSPERWTRSQVQRLLSSHFYPSVVEPLDAWTAKVKDEPLLRQALGIYAARETVRPKLLGHLLTAKDARVRAYATRMVGAWSDRLPASQPSPGPDFPSAVMMMELRPNALALLRARSVDPDARVRLEAIVAMTNVAGAEAVDISVMTFVRSGDGFIDYAVAESIRSVRFHWKTSYPGKAVYDAHCLKCHQADANGLPGIFPPLAGSEWVNGDKGALIKMLLHGLSGPITVKGEPFGTGNPIPMPPSGLDDQKTADVLTYIRANFGNQADAVTPEEVRTLREKHTDRTTLWTVPELTPAK
ncbi:MAG: c-type cytochrome [Chthoniobacter sp.]|nr:c-type cytochrome [Chthoniobacter sp.]